MKRLFRVDVSFTGCVMADSEEDAIHVYLSDALNLPDDPPSFETVSPINTIEQIPEGWHSSLPWGGDNDDTVSNIAANQNTLTHRGPS